MRERVLSVWVGFSVAYVVRKVVVTVVSLVYSLVTIGFMFVRYLAVDIS